MTRRMIPNQSTAMGTHSLLLLLLLLLCFALSFFGFLFFCFSSSRRLEVSRLVGAADDVARRDTTTGPDTKEKNKKVQA